MILCTWASHWVAVELSTAYALRQRDIGWLPPFLGQYPSLIHTPIYVYSFKFVRHPLWPTDIHNRVLPPVFIRMVDSVLKRFSINSSGESTVDVDDFLHWCGIVVSHLHHVFVGALRQVQLDERTRLMTHQSAIPESVEEKNLRKVFRLWSTGPVKKRDRSLGLLRILA